MVKKAGKQRTLRKVPEGTATRTARIERERPPWRPRQGSPESSERTRAGILWAAERVLATAGYAAFTTRAVAAAAGITPGNLAYHYASKRDLLRAVISSLIAEYARHIDGYLADPANRAHDGFSRLAVWLIQDSAARVTSRLSRELWAMALNDPFVRDALDDFYARSAERIIAVLRRSHPGLSESAAREVVHLLMMISEGANSMDGTCVAVLHRR